MFFILGLGAMLGGPIRIMDVRYFLQGFFDCDRIGHCPRTRGLVNSELRRDCLQLLHLLKQNVKCGPLLLRRFVFLITTVQILVFIVLELVVLVFASGFRLLLRFSSAQLS